MTRRRRAGLWTFFKLGALTGLVLAAILLLTLYVEHGSALELPAPTGPWAVGRLVTVWTDATRIDPFAQQPGQPRELLVWIWYPAARSAAATPAGFEPSFARGASDPQASWLLQTFLWRDPAVVQVHSVEGAEARLPPDPVRWPAIVFRSGIGVAAVDYTSLCEELASQGFVVVAADAPYSTWSVAMPDGRVIHKTDQGNPGDAPMPEAERSRLLDELLAVWVADTRFLIDGLLRLDAGQPPGAATNGAEAGAAPREGPGLFAGRIDPRAIGVAGHSFGGATAAEVCRVDGRVRAGADLDGALQGETARLGIGKPFLFLLSDHGADLDPEDRAIAGEIRAAAAQEGRDGLVVTLVDADHFSFTDYPLLQSHVLRRVLVALGGPIGRLDGRAGLAATGRCLAAFFDVQLRGAPREALDAALLVPGVRREPR